MKSAVLMLSGGIDSTVVLVELARAGIDVHAITYDYGQSLATAEISAARSNAERFARRWHLVPMSFGLMAPSCSLLGPGDDVPRGRSTQAITASGTPPTYVPLRNAVFLAWCAAYAEAHGIDRIFGGCNGLNSGNYRDDTREFGDAMTAALRIGCGTDYRPEIVLPMANLTKAAVVRRGVELSVDFRKTHSCYLPGPGHCGDCDSCVWRLQAMTANGMDMEGNRP